jgi:hypothetical protein
MYFTDVVEALMPAKLDYATSAVPLDIVDAVNLKADSVAFLAQIDHPILREQVRDYFINQQFRKDIYMRGVPRLRPVEQRERLLSSRFVLIQDAELVPMKVQGALGEADLQAPVYQPIIKQFASKQNAPKTLKEVLSALPDLNYTQVLQAVIVLTSMGAIAPCQGEATVKQVRKTCDALNINICERAQFGTVIGHLASPVMGAGINVNRIDQLFLLALFRKNTNPCHFVWSILNTAGEALVIAGEVIQGAEANIAEIQKRLKTFNDKTLPILKAVGIA